MEIGPMLVATANAPRAAKAWYDDLSTLAKWVVKVCGGFTVIVGAVTAWSQSPVPSPNSWVDWRVEQKTAAPLFELKSTAGVERIERLNSDHERLWGEMAGLQVALPKAADDASKQIVINRMGVLNRLIEDNNALRRKLQGNVP